MCALLFLSLTSRLVLPLEREPESRQGQDRDQGRILVARRHRRRKARVEATDTQEDGVRQVEQGENHKESARAAPAACQGAGDQGNLEGSQEQDGAQPPRGDA